MHRTVQSICLSILLLSFLATGSIAQTTETGLTAASNESIVRLAEAVEKLAELLKSRSAEDKVDSELRKLDIAISYLNFRSRRIETIERDLGMLRTDRSRIEDTLSNWQERRDMMTNTLEEKSGEEKEALQSQILEMEAREKLVAQRMARYDEEIIILENRIIELQNELDSVESYVQQHLNM